MKRTYQPKKRKRARTHGFRARMRTPRGPARAQAAAREGPPPAHPVADGRPEGGRRRRRLSRSGEFERVYREGRSHASRYLVVYAFPREDDEEGPRLGVSVGRKLGGAVERNRSSACCARPSGRPRTTCAGGHDFVIVARPAAGELAEREGERGIEAALREVLAEAGLAREEGRVTRAAQRRRRAGALLPAVHLPRAAAPL